MAETPLDHVKEAADEAESAADELEERGDDRDDPGQQRKRQQAWHDDPRARARWRRRRYRRHDTQRGLLPPWHLHL